jgi:hypothetical protein
MMRGWFLLACFSFTGCYEGWEHYRDRQKPEVPQPPIPQIKPIYYVLYQPIVMTEAATKSASCMANQAIVEYKNNEWSLRESATMEMLQKNAEVVVWNPIRIGPSDCQNVAAVTAAADSLTPWGLEDPPSQDSLDRVAIHLRAPMWEEEPTSSPNQRVTRTHWAAWQKMVNEGRNAKSHLYLVVSNATNGYFSQWGAELTEGDQSAGTAIDIPDPSEGGIEARENIIKADVAALQARLLSVAASD